MPSARRLSHEHLATSKAGSDVWTLAIDIGGTGTKASVLDLQGAMLAERVRSDTPVGVPPSALIRAVAVLAR
jgi:polyphosphate glucokinase